MDLLARVFGAALTRLSTVAAAPGDTEDQRLLKALGFLTVLILLPISLVWAALLLAAGSWTFLLAILYFLVSVASIALFLRIRDDRLFLRLELLDVLLVPTLGMIPLGGFVGAGAVGLWGLLAPMGALVFEDVPAAVAWGLAFDTAFIGSGIVGMVIGPSSVLPDGFRNVFLALNVIVGGTMMFILLAIFAQLLRDARAALQVEQRRSEGLLLNILPRTVAERLKDNPTTVATRFRGASVLFADVVDFTPRSEDLGAADLVALLDRLFGTFDALTERHGLEKIKTIGDAYMVAAGVPDPRPDHALALARFALEMLECVRPGGEVGDLGVQVRVGMNSGPVVAGVIGNRKFAYDLWGDTVNTASRMESAGTPGRIQVTRATYERLRDEFILEPRGSIPVKGKGKLETWYLVGEKVSGAADEPVPASIEGTLHP
jgi:adenylate cyclase